MFIGRTKENYGFYYKYTWFKHNNLLRAFENETPSTHGLFK